MLNNKIKNLLLIKDMSPSRFADEIGVQRPIVSHILSGRNRPSLEVVQKIIRRFPELGLDWIIEEDDPEEGETGEKNTLVPQAQVRLSHTEPVHEPVSKEHTAVGEAAPAEKKVEKILIFYTDKTFSEYRPG